MRSDYCVSVSYSCNPLWFSHTDVTEIVCKVSIHDRDRRSCFAVGSNTSYESFCETLEELWNDRLHVGFHDQNPLPGFTVVEWEADKEWFVLDKRNINIAFTVAKKNGRTLKLRIHPHAVDESYNESSQRKRSNSYQDSQKFNVQYVKWIHMYSQLHY